MPEPQKSYQQKRTIYPNYHEDTNLSKHTFDISENFSTKVLELIEKAFELSETISSRELTPQILLKTLQNDSDANGILGYYANGATVQVDLENKNENVDIVILSVDVKKILLIAFLEAQKFGRKMVEIDDIVLAMIQVPNVNKVLNDIDLFEAEKRASERLGGSISTTNSQETPILSKYSVDLVQLATTGKINDVIGRDNEIQRVIQILTRQTKSNPVLLGEPGVGKTAIVEGLAKMIAEDKIVEPLRGVRILSLNLVSLISAANSIGRAENLIEGIIEEAKSSGNIILFIDELHTITGGGDSNEAQTIANILKPALARGDIHVIGATTLAEYRKYIEKDPALSRRFEPVRADEPSIETSVLILTNVAKKLEEFHKVRITPDAIDSAVKLSKRYIQDRFLPDKAIDLLDEASSKIVLQGRNTLEAEDIRLILADKTGIPVQSLSTDDQQRLASLEQYLSTYVIGQEHAVHVVSEAIRRARAGLKDPNKPTGSFLFLGPSGVGKTELAKVLAREIYHTEKALIRLDMSEFSEQHTVQRLVGAPPGYVGYDEGGQLTNPVWEQPYSLILLDEIEKAHPKVFDIFLQVLDDGRLTDGQGRTVDFKNTIIIATSNIASDEILEVIKQNDKSKLSDPEFIQETIIPILRDYFRPEFINRFDEVVVFNPLGKEELIQIARLQIKKIEQRLAEQNIKLVVKEETLQAYANETYNPQFGARPLKRLIQDQVENKVARMIIEGQIKPGGVLEI